MRTLLRLLAVLFLSVAAASGATSQPSFLWITTEDMSADLGCYGDPDARTPSLDALARTSVRYTHAFAPSPVCSPARSTLITGISSTSLGTQRLRSQFPVPPEVKPFPAALRRLGYHCTNNVKTDYNLRNEPAFIAAAWDQNSATADWRSRRQGQPFFSVINLMTTHQSRTGIWSVDEFEREIGAKLTAAERADPARLALPPFYPDTPGARQAWARYRDCITMMDHQVGEILERLRADGLAEDTVIFFFSDHGMGLPRGKRTLYDSGLRVPLLVHVPEKWRHLAPGYAPGTVDRRFVTFIDFAPTLLALAGAPAQPHHVGRVFLGPKAAEPREYVHGARDRVDDAFDVARSVRDRRWLYVRNYMPHLSWMQPEGYSDGAEFRRELSRLAAAGQATGGFASYAAPRRPREELYDTDSDPFQLRNLAGKPEHQDVVARMRAELERWQLASRDAGFLTEPQMWARLRPGESARDVARDDTRYPLARLLTAAGAVGDEAAAGRQRAWLRDPDDAVRYWAAVGLNARPTLEPADREALRAALGDASPVVRLEAAGALGRAGATEAALPVLREGLTDASPIVALHAARALQSLGAKATSLRTVMAERLAAARKAEAAGDDYSMFIRFALEAAMAPAAH
jgi:N-sulfoglucosamine sulfohydrolase